MANEEAKEAAAKPSDRTAFLAEARKRFKRCVDANVRNREYQLDDIRFAAGSPDNGWQWPDDVLNKRMKDPNGARPTLTENRLPQHIKLVTNEQRKNKPQGKVLPVDDKGDIEVAEVLNGVIRHIEVASHADVAYDTACENQVTIGEGYWRVLTDYIDERSFDQDIRIAAVKNSFSVYIDPDSLKRDATGRLAEYAFVTERLPTADYEREFPDAKSKADWDDLRLGDDTFTWFDDEGVLIAEYFYVEREKTKVIAWSDGSTTLGDEMPKVAGLMPVGERQTEIRRVKWCKINGIEVLEKRDWAGKFIPIVRVVGNEWDVEGELVVSGLVRNAKDTQRMINYWASQEAEMLALMPKAPFIGAVGQFETYNDQWRDANITAYSRLEYDPVDVNGTLLPPPKRAEPPLPPVGIVQAKLGAVDAMQAVIGQYNPSLGAEAKEKSGKAILARQQQADVGTFHYIDNLSRSIGYSTEIVLDLIPKIYDTERVLRIIGEDGEPDHCRMCAGQGVAVQEVEDEAGEVQKIYDPSVGKYDVVVTVGPSYTTKRIESAESMMAFVQAAPESMQLVGDLIARNMDWPGAQEFAKRLKKAIPPNILADEDADPNDVEAQKAQVQAAAQALGEREAALQGAQQQAEQVAQQATEQEARAKEATAKAQAKVDELNTAIAELKAERELLAMQKKLAEKEMQIERTELASERAVLQAEVKTLQANMEKKLAEINDADANLERERKTDGETAAVVAQLMQAIEEVRSLATAEREIVYDDQGEPVRSRIVMPQPQAMQ